MPTSKRRNVHKQEIVYVICNSGNKLIKKLFLFQVCSDTNAYDFNLDQGFLANENAPIGTLGQTDTSNAVTTYALIGTYCTTNNNSPAGLANVEDTYTGDYITIAGESFFKKSY